MRLGAVSPPLPPPKNCSLRLRTISVGLGRLGIPESGGGVASEMGSANALPAAEAKKLS